jgi:hypothetical protein
MLLLRGDCGNIPRAGKKKRKRKEKNNPTPSSDFFLNAATMISERLCLTT